jgi:hypothetical protein
MHALVLLAVLATDGGVARVGSLPKEAIRDVIKADREGVNACYEAALKTNGALAGRIAMRFTVSGEGVVTKAEVASASITDGAMIDCVRGRVLGWKFPKPTGGGLVTVTYPFVFGNEKVEDAGRK